MNEVFTILQTLHRKDELRHSVNQRHVTCDERTALEHHHFMTGMKTIPIFFETAYSKIFRFIRLSDNNYSIAIKKLNLLNIPSKYLAVLACLGIGDI